MHHIVSDGWSIGVLLRELAALYAAFARRAAVAAAARCRSSTPTTPSGSAQLARGARRWSGSSPTGARSLAGAPALLELPADRPAAGRCRRIAAALPSALVLPPACRPLLAALARARGATLFMILLAGFQALLARCTGQDDVVVGSPVAEPQRGLETEGLIGFFVNTLVLRADLSGDPGFRELLGRVREAALGAYAHQDLPFEQLVEELQPRPRAWPTRRCSR